MKYQEYGWGTILVFLGFAGWCAHDDLWLLAVVLGLAAVWAAHGLGAEKKQERICQAFPDLRDRLFEKAMLKRKLKRLKRKRFRDPREASTQRLLLEFIANAGEVDTLRSWAKKLEAKQRELRREWHAPQHPPAKEAENRDQEPPGKSGEDNGNSTAAPAQVTPTSGH